jgi:hypothetical protein
MPDDADVVFVVPARPLHQVVRIPLVDRRREGLR